MRKLQGMKCSHLCMLLTVINTSLFNTFQCTMPSSPAVGTPNQKLDAVEAAYQCQHKAPDNSKGAWLVNTSQRTCLQVLGYILGQVSLCLPQFVGQQQFCLLRNTMVAEGGGSSWHYHWWCHLGKYLYQKSCSSPALSEGQSTFLHTAWLVCLSAVLILKTNSL